jgi:segregation and condensation protein B
MSSENIKSTVEALIFASGDPISTDRICEILDCTEDEALACISDLSAEYKNRGSAMQIIKLNDSWQMTTLPQYAAPIRRMLEIQRNTPLSQAAFEVLAVVAYNQPVTKSFVEQVRGVDCSGVISSLVEKGLVEERGRLELPGRPLIYGTTDRFLRCFSLETLSDLPELPHDEEKPEDAENVPSESNDNADVSAK